MGFSRHTGRRLVRAGALASALLFSVAVSADDPAQDVDPLLVSSTFVGGNGYETPSGAVFGPDGALWIAASSTSTNIPGAERAPGADDESDVVVLRLDPATRRVISAAWLGGSLNAFDSSADWPVALAFDGAGNAYVAGTTMSGDFPATSVFGSTGGEADGSKAFVARVLPDGSGFAWVALLGGSYFDRAMALCVTDDGDPVVLGVTSSADFPLRDPVQSTFGGYWDIFVTRIRADGSRIEFSTYLGRDGPEYPGVIAASPGGTFVIAGTTAGSDLFPQVDLIGTTTDLFQYRGFLAEIDPAARTLRRAAYLGDTTISGISFETAGTLLLAGTGTDPDVRIARSPHGAPGEDIGLGIGDALLLRLDATTWDLLGGTYFGGSGAESQVALSTGADGTLWLTGSTLSTDLPVPGAVRRKRTGYADDAFAAAFDPANLALEYATYIGGTGTESSAQVAAGPDGSAWIVGATESLDFPLRDPVLGRGDVYDLFVTRVRHGDPAGRPGTPDLQASDPLAPATARLRWTAGAGPPETNFFIERKDVGDFGRVAILPAGTTEWTDAAALPDRGYTYTVQAVNEAGASAPSREVRLLTPGSVRLRVDTGRMRFDRHGAPVEFRLEGAIEPLAGVAARPDLRAAGVRLFVYASNGPLQILSIDPDDPLWTRARRRLRWQNADARLDFRRATGEFDLRVHRWAPSLRAGGTMAIRLETGVDAATVSTVWSRLSRFRISTQ